jgi:hypothetical protein
MDVDVVCSNWGVYGQRFAEVVMPLVQIQGSTNVTHTAGLIDSSPQLTALAGEGYALTWQGQQAGGPDDIFTAVYGADGQPVGGTSVVNVSNIVGFTSAQLTALAGGGYALTWQGQHADGPDDIFTAASRWLASASRSYLSKHGY